MKQETIDFIKSMTEHGFLVIVDPGKLKGDGAVMIEVINLKEVASKASDEKINDQIAKLTGFKKEEPKPEIDLLKCDGRRFRAKIEGVECEGVVSVDSLGSVYLCQNNKDGEPTENKKGYKFSWVAKRGHGWIDSLDADIYKVTDFELPPEPKVIFTNCVGEVFTEEDARSGVNAWWIDDDKITCRPIFGITVFSRRADDSWQIFRSKKSLLKYLYETCE